MCILTHDGRYLAGKPDEILESLAADLGGLHDDRDRVARYRRTIGPEFAAFSARQILLGLDEDGLILIRPLHPVGGSR